MSIFSLQFNSLHFHSRLFLLTPEPLYSVFSCRGHHHLLPPEQYQAHAQTGRSLPGHTLPPPLPCTPLTCFPKSNGSTWLSETGRCSYSGRLGRGVRKQPCCSRAVRHLCGETHSPRGSTEQGVSLASQSGASCKVALETAKGNKPGLGEELLFPRPHSLLGVMKNKLEGSRN